MNHLLVIGFCLVNVGFVALLLRSGSEPVSFREVLELLIPCIRVVLLVLGKMHFFNLFVLSMARITKKAKPGQGNVGEDRPAQATG